MADSLLDLGTTPVFSIPPNWAQRPISNMNMLRRLISQPGSAQTIASLTDHAPISFDSTFLVWLKADENTLLTFFCARRGRCQRFWVRHPKKAFTLKTAASSGATTLYCEPNNAESQFQGYERIYILMRTGDLLTRQVNAVTYNEAQERVELAINSSLDRDVTLTNHLLIGRMLLVRLDNDELRLSLKSDRTTEFSLGFQELVEEYSIA